MKPDPRDTYVKIATRRFAQHGFHGTSLAALAKDAGVSKQALLHFFGTKERLYGDVLDSLCTRLCAEIENTFSPDPTSHLRAYFNKVAQSLLDDPQDVRLVVRALLESDPTAQTWPLRPYLERLTDLIRSVPKGTNMSRHTALAEAYRFIGSVQYVAISLPTIQGIYGKSTRDALANAVFDSVEQEIARISRQ